MTATEHFLNGNSCSESIILGSIEKGWCDKSLLPVATSFSGGIGSGCLCGAISGSLMVIGHLFGKENPYGNPQIAKQTAKEFMDKFKEENKVTCCRILSRGFDFGSPERKQHCVSFVDFCFNNLDTLINKSLELIKNEQH